MTAAWNVSSSIFSPMSTSFINSRPPASTNKREFSGFPTIASRPSNASMSGLLGSIPWRTNCSVSLDTFCPALSSSSRLVSVARSSSFSLCFLMRNSSFSIFFRTSMPFSEMFSLFLYALTAHASRRALTMPFLTKWAMFSGFCATRARKTTSSSTNFSTLNILRIARHEMSMPPSKQNCAKTSSSLSASLLRRIFDAFWTLSLFW
mmetsp:Transcript_26968/g.42786  ORF Transcript_26968/g.42786 Transcript_26968/m.42786 type:complete len:206 (-) Transcript_26968:2424-3041(-)